MAGLCNPWPPPVPKSVFAVAAVGARVAFEDNNRDAVLVQSDRAAQPRHAAPDDDNPLDHPSALRSQIVRHSAVDAHLPHGGGMNVAPSRTSASRYPPHTSSCDPVQATTGREPNQSGMGLA